MIKKLDHLVITTEDIKACTAFYSKLQFKIKESGGRYEFFAGDFKINVHLFGNELSPHATNVECGSADLCFEVDREYFEWVSSQDFDYVYRDVLRNGAMGQMRSTYIYDPDGNLLEFSLY